MKDRILVPILCLLLALVLPGLSDAAVVFKPGQKTKYVAPGEEELSGNAQQLFQAGQDAEKQGNVRRAIKAYRSLVRKHPKDALAPGAAYRAGQLFEQVHDYLNAADSYRYLVERYPASPNFEESIE
ncbi:MAG: hypothetical protein JWO45_576 [Spartobacteria bacterium]|nr:hypothetical protein [Spartobacteria bacterium]